MFRLSSTNRAAAGPTTVAARRRRRDARDLRAAIARSRSRPRASGREAAEVRGLIDDTHEGVGSAARRRCTALAGQVQEITRAQDGIGGVIARPAVEAVERARGAVEDVGHEVAGIVATLREVADAAGAASRRSRCRRGWSRSTRRSRPSAPARPGAVSASWPTR